MGLVVDSYRFGVAAAFSPLDIAGCVLWLDASDTSTITDSGGAVSQWDDKSASGNDATQSTAAQKPTTGTRTQNSLNVIDFDGGDVLSLTGAVSVGNTTAKTIFIVAVKDAQANQNNLLGSTSSIGNWLGFSTSSSSGPVNANLGSGQATSSTNLAPGTYGIITVRHTGSASGNNLSVGLNGAGFGSNAQSTNIANYDKIGFYANSGTTFFLNGAIAEIVVYDTDLVTSDREDVEDYLTTKWGI